MPEWADQSDSQWTVEECPRPFALSWIKRWHYSARYPGPGTHAYALNGPDPIAVVTLSIPNNPHGVAAKYGLRQWNGNVELSRLVVHPDAPRLSASWALGRFIGHWKTLGLDWIFSYADTGQGHHGGIYQAINALFVGTSPARHGFLCNGTPMHPRSVVSRWGTQRMRPGRNGEPTCMDLAARDGLTLVPVPGINAAKHLYLIPVGSPTTRRAIRRHLAPYSLPYPKRSDDATRLTEADSNRGEASYGKSRQETAA